jgi:TolB-like protein
MASLFAGYEYDIFISYRQKDNEYDGWVTEFVDNLKRELHATFKEDISIYFDISPQDGLLETHIVDESLAKKLKCLIFIPIISQTYCDLKSFAWQHEFCVFNKLAKEDQFGRDIRLSSGNVASRILPIKINDLDPEDKTLLETELGGVLRCIEFIYKSAGVNRPLRANEDHPQDNLNKTYYRDQINKVANAVKEIIGALKKHNQREGTVQKEVTKAKFDKPRILKTKIIIVSVITLALIVLGYFLVPTLSKPKEQLEKSIAVLPFKSLSDDPAQQYLSDGTMDAILLHLQKFNDLRVLSRTSVEQYRGTKKTTYTIGQELGVAYLLEGSFQKSGDNVRLIVQLIKANKKEDHAWANEYDRTWKDIFSVQSEVAQTIAKELHAIITPEEKQLINKIPTTNLTAYDFYQQGREEHTKYWIDNSNKAALQKAEGLYHKALKYDSTFAKAYSGLAWIYWDKHGKEKEYFSESFLDTLSILTKIALSFDNQLSEAYTLRGYYFSDIGKPQQAIEEFDKAIKLNPNDWMAYRGKGEFYSNADFVNWINYLQKAASINRGQALPILIGEIGWAYEQAGFPEKAKQFYQDKLKLDGDSLSYYGYLSGEEFWLGNFNKSIEYGEKGYKIDSTDALVNLLLGFDHLWLRHNVESLKFLKKWSEKLKAQGEFDWDNIQYIAFVYWQNGYNKEAEYYFSEQIKHCNMMIELKRIWAQKLYTYYDLAGIYAFKGERDKALKNLRIFNQIQRIPLWMSMLIKTDPLFNSIRNEPEFQQIAKDIEAKYQAEHERVRKWLEEQGTLNGN